MGFIRIKASLGFKIRISMMVRVRDQSCVRFTYFGGDRFNVRIDFSLGLLLWFRLGLHLVLGSH